MYRGSTRLSLVHRQSQETVARARVELNVQPWTPPSWPSKVPFPVYRQSEYVWRLFTVLTAGSLCTIAALVHLFSMDAFECGVCRFAIVCCAKLNVQPWTPHRGRRRSHSPCIASQSVCLVSGL